MRRFWLAVVAAAGCGGDNSGAPDSNTIEPPPDAAADAPADRLQVIYDQVDGAHILQLVQEMSGVVPVTVDGQQIQITERFDDVGRQNYRAYWTQYMKGLGLQVNPLHFAATTNDRATDDLEAVLPGKSADSFVIIVHYDSMGPSGAETTNPAADDDMSGMSMELETARILVAHKTELEKTVRFVAADAEELGGLAGARNYATYIKSLSQSSGFAITAAIDDEQTGWNCRADGACPDATVPTFDIFSCSGDSQAFSYAAMGDAFETIVTTYSPLKVVRDCMAQNSDHYAMWEIGVPTVVFSEHDPFINPHFDQEGNDFFSAIDGDYLVSIATCRWSHAASPESCSDHFGVGIGKPHIFESFAITWRWTPPFMLPSGTM